MRSEICAQPRVRASVRYGDEREERRARCFRYIDFDDVWVLICLQCGSLFRRAFYLLRYTFYRGRCLFRMSVTYSPCQRSFVGESVAETFQTIVTTSTTD